MRQLTAIGLVVALAACSADAGASVAPTPSASAAATASPEVPSPSAEPSTEADWSALEPLDALVAETLPLSADWPWQFVTLIGDDLWSPNGSEGAPPAVARVDAGTMEITAVIDLGGEEGVFPPDAWGSAPSQGGGLWVPLAYQKQVALIDQATNEVARRVDVNGTPYAVVQGAYNLWIADWENSQVFRIDVSSGKETLNIQGITEPTAIVIGEEGLWVNEHSGTEIVRLDPETGEELARVEIGGRPGMVLGLGSVWARSDDERSVSRIDPATNTVVATIPMPSNPTGLAIAGGSVWVATTPQRGSCESNSYLVRIDPASNEADGVMEIPCLFGVMSDGTTLWAGSASEDGPVMLRLDPGSRS